MDGSVTVAGGGEYPPFRIGEPRFDQKTFYGRLRHFMDVIDPRTLFTSKVTLENSIKMLDDFKVGIRGPSVTDKDLWEAQKIKQAIIHPDTGEKIFMPFRMSGFVPFGAPIFAVDMSEDRGLILSFVTSSVSTFVLPNSSSSLHHGSVSMTEAVVDRVTGLLLPNQGLAQVVFWQWLNQSHNACVNYANRNATKPTPMSRFIMGYTGAVTSAVAIAVSLNLLIKRANTLGPATKMIIQKFVPFPAVATASICNVVLMRNNELSEGIYVLDSKNQVVGSSQTAAKKALKETAMTRAFLPAPILLIPPIIMTMLERTRFLKNNPRMHLPCNAATATLAFGLALPVAIALFPQMSTISRSELEPEIQAATDEDTLYYNKGL